MIERMCLYESLNNGAVDLCDLADMNDELDARGENRWRAAEHMKGK